MEKEVDGKHETLIKNTFMCSAKHAHPTMDVNKIVDFYWDTVNEKYDNLSDCFIRTSSLPIARVKRIMKLDEDVKMISSEVPILFAKAAELFITELTVRSWIITSEHKRRTLQKSDIATAVSQNDMYDFLIDVLPRDDPVKGLSYLDKNLFNTPVKNKKNEKNVNM
ncbi:hypothetical protein A3Q56_03491 [Intoshia linei]|uniref:Transcription factor CBF/NF-Y/archaeal histone domain-containing protein n=1 Tax=Intoshia linei TaxID=1819745 RepID=A0A177B3B5_9BILA|nr:hypothetical protein A3Q56_03491 [Intoshia linei]